MWNKTVLLMAVVVFALPAIAGDPSKPVKNTHELTPKTTAPKAPRHLLGPKSGSQAKERPEQHTSSTYGKANINYKPQDTKPGSATNNAQLGSVSFGVARPATTAGGQSSGKSNNVPPKPTVGPVPTVPVNAQPSIPPPK
jgi:hypothetical protein